MKDLEEYLCKRIWSAKLWTSSMDNEENKNSYVNKALLIFAEEDVGNFLQLDT